MSNVTVCVRFRPLSSKERKINGDNLCFRDLDPETFIFKDEKEEDATFCFDRVFYQNSEQSDVYDFLALPIVEDVINGINGTILTYGQTGAGKTYSMEGPSIMEFAEDKKGLLHRVVDGLFEFLRFSPNITAFTVKLSMVEIYMEKVRDLFDLSKDNLQIKESKTQGIFIYGATEIPITNVHEALKCLSHGIGNRAVGETQMNLASSRSHCVYIFSVQQESLERVKNGKVILVDLAGSEKVEKTGAEGRLLEEAKTINKSLSALGNVINALTNGKTNHVPYRDSKLTRILQDALGGNSRTALLCCCSPSPLNASESLSTLRFGTRSKLIKSLPRSIPTEEDSNKKQSMEFHALDDSYWRILSELRESLREKDVDLLEKLFVIEGIFSIPQTTDEFDLAIDDVTVRTITLLQQTVQEFKEQVDELEEENKKLRAELAVAQQLAVNPGNMGGNCFIFGKLMDFIRFLLPWVDF